MTPQSLPVKLVAVPLGMRAGKLHVLAHGRTFKAPGAVPGPDGVSLFHRPLHAGGTQAATLEAILRSAAEFHAARPGVTRVQSAAQREPETLLAQWFASQRFVSRVVDVLDVPATATEPRASLEVVRAIAVPDDVFAALGAPTGAAADEVWLEVDAVLSGKVEGFSKASCKIVAAAAGAVPDWTRHGSFAFELLPPVFSIQDLRLLLGHMTSQDIDAGNFHRRLKRLDLLRPMVGGQRVHRWEFDWSKTETLRRESLIP